MSSIKCGNCKQTHETVAEVRNCHGANVDTKVVANINPGVNQDDRDRLLATDRQVDFLRKLIAERDLTGTAYPQWSDPIEGHTVLDGCEPRHLLKKHAHAAIQDLLSKPMRLTPSQTPASQSSAKDALLAASKKLPNVPTMRYAVEMEIGTADEGKRFNFYKVDKPGTGRWAGYTFVKRMSSDEEVRISIAEQAIALGKIAADPQKAAADYGLQSNKCGKCHRALTRDDSRERGYGPKCAGLLSFDF